jgi:hypothetical protein
VVELSKERSAKLVKKWPYVVARYAHMTLARDPVNSAVSPKPPISSTVGCSPPQYFDYIYLKICTHLNISYIFL